MISRTVNWQTGDVFTVCFADCHFDEKVFSVLRENVKKVGKNINGV